MRARVLTAALFFAAIGLVSAAAFNFGARAQSGNTNSSRQRVASPSPSPTPRSEDEETLRSDEVLRTETNLTNIFFTAADKHKRFISTLKREDVRVLEDGVAQQIFTFQQNIDLPLSLAVLIDTSRSEERTLPDEKVAAQAFLEAVMRPQKDEAAVVSFTGESTLEQGLTGNVSRLRRAIERVEYVPPTGLIGGGVVVGGTPPISDSQQMLAGSTAIWDAVLTTSNEVLRESAEHTRRAIILLTDGQDTSSQVHENDGSGDGNGGLLGGVLGGNDDGGLLGVDHLLGGGLLNGVL